MSDAFGFSSAELESVDDSGDLAPYDFSTLERKARYNALPDDIKECVNLLTEDAHRSEEGAQYFPLWEVDAATVQLLDYLGAL